jgi:magnesium chelatase family protein
MVSRYQKRISGPLLDRIDIHVEVPRVDYEKLSSDPLGGDYGRLGEPSAAVRKRVEAARERQRLRFAGTGGGEHTGLPLQCNADMGPAEIRQQSALWVFCLVDEAGKSRLKAATPAVAAQVQGCSRCT